MVRCGRRLTTWRTVCERTLSQLTISLSVCTEKTFCCVASWKGGTCSSYDRTYLYLGCCCFSFVFFCALSRRPPARASLDFGWLAAIVARCCWLCFSPSRSLILPLIPAVVFPAFLAFYFAQKQTKCLLRQLRRVVEPLRLRLRLHKRWTHSPFNGWRLGTTTSSMVRVSSFCPDWIAL